MADMRAPGPRGRLVAPGGVERPAGTAPRQAADPVILALAQLVRDRHERELREAGARRAAVRLMHGGSDAPPA